MQSVPRHEAGSVSPLSIALIEAERRKSGRPGSQTYSHRRDCLVSEVSTVDIQLTISSR